MRPADVLQQLDAAAEEFLFPDLDNGYYYGVDVRLHAYHDARRWALVVEAVGYSPRAGNLTDVLHVFGNCLTQGAPGYDNGDFLDRVDNWDDIEHDEPEIYRGGPIVVRGQAISVAAEPGEELVDVLRRLVPDYRELLLAKDAELRRRIPPTCLKCSDLTSGTTPISPTGCGRVRRRHSARSRTS
nr:hypothetical protein [Verrucosispora sioxanthis]